MIIKKIILENIRSYSREEIDFQTGTTLLSGDIGSGKSTILLAIEFALFGVVRGEVTPESLLRYGEEKGAVELTIQLDDKKIQVKRLLKRTSTSITQDNGFLIIDDKIEQLAPTELKQRIIDLLNYPKEMLTKKSLVYRYTVYTPQEEMKSILLADKETRIDSLRKIFNIDKYKRVKDNSKVLTQEIKIKRREIASSIHDLEEKKEKLAERTKNLETLIEEKNQINLESIKDLVSKHREQIKLLESSIEAITKLKADVEGKASKIESLERLQESNNRLIEDLNKGLVELEQEISLSENQTSTKEEKWKYEDTVKVFEEQLTKLIERIGQLRAAKDSSKELKNKITDLHNCPTCLQPVQHGHKEKILQEEATKILKFNKELEEALHKQEDIKAILEKAKAKLEQFKSQEAKIGMMAVRQQDLERRNEQIHRLTKDLETLQTEITDLKQQKLVIETDLVRLSDVNQGYDEAKIELDKLLEKEKELEIQHATKSKEISFLEESIYEIKREVVEKEKEKKSLNKYTEIQEMLENKFLPLINKIEKTVLISVQNLFNTIFQEKFRILIDDEDFSVAIDEEFTPKINYNEYDIDYKNLSGGEKTACALAYRLALNSVINHLIAKIKTKDLIMLDEPTDGFSSEQLDKMRDVLEQLNIAQTIIVSHESKVESFVDNVIRITKEKNTSKVVI
jgi:DNA repair protein SbcC/Rad50